MLINDIKKTRAPPRDPCFHIIKLSVYKNPLSVFKIKIEVKKRDKIFVYNIHLVALLAYKSN
jgi:hypothetical protein